MNAFGLGFVNTGPATPVCMLIGWIAGRLWLKFGKASHGRLMYSVSAGLIAGIGIAGVIKAALTIGSVPGKNVLVGCGPGGALKGYQGGLCHVKIYITRRKKFAKISNLKTEKTAVEGYLEEVRLDIDAFTTYHSQTDIVAIKALLSDLQLDRTTLTGDKIGHYTESKTGKLEQFAVRSNLPEYEVYDNNTGAPIDTHTLSQRLQDSDDYKDIVNVRETFLRMAPLDPKVVPEEPFVIRFLDTPGFNDTNYRDIEHAETIIDEIVRIKSFNLIFVVISIHPAIHKEQSVAFDYYSGVIKALQGHHSNVVFLYTHVKYEGCHQNNTKHQTNFQQKHKAFSYLFRERGSVAPEGEIDL
ncbi:hypothetical protein BGZ74_009683 [Mortierella antarctica]|nr:hypothetical protein BGZ74_009683 [Mortierella antarctica]